MTGLYPGEFEPAKRVVHRGMQLGAGVCALYNGVAWLARREQHLLVNTMLYGLLWAVEREQVNRHGTRTRTPE